MRVDVEGHGRQDLFDDVDVSETVGWFTSLYPVLLQTAAAGVTERIQTVKQTFRSIPNGGLGFGVLRFLGDDATVAQLAALPQAQVSFNYLGRFDASLRDSSPIFGQGSDTLTGGQHAPNNERAYELDVNASLLGNQLTIHFSYTSRVGDARIRAVAARMVESLRALTEHTRNGHQVAPVPADFELADGLDRSGLNAIVAHLERE